MTDSARLVDGTARRRQAAVTGLTAVLAASTACSSGALPADEQRTAMIETTGTVIEQTAEIMRTDSIDVTDDADELRACPDGGTRYVYAATIGPVAWGSFGTTAGGALTDVETRFLGLMRQMRTNPIGADAARFDSADIVDPPTADGDRHVTYRVTSGDFKEVTLSFGASTTDTDKIIVDLTGATRCD